MGGLPLQDRSPSNWTTLGQVATGSDGQKAAHALAVGRGATYMQRDSVRAHGEPGSHGLRLRQRLAMRILVFGAGASYGCGRVRPEAPPLGTGLFEALARSFPGTWGGLPKQIDLLFRENFEAGMQELWAQYSQVVPELTQQMALFFVQFRPTEKGCTLYSQLVAAAISPSSTEPTLFSTLNYECLLEYAAWEVGIPVDYFGPPSSGALSVWKLHGGCNLLPTGMRATRGVQFTQGVTFGTEVAPARDLNEVCEFCLGDNALPPVMSLFMKGKPVQVSPQSVAAIQQEWGSAVLRASTIIVVGVNPNPEDSHIWDPLATTAADLWYCGAPAQFHQWSKSHRSRSTRYLGGTFEEARVDIIALLRS